MRKQSGPLICEACMDLQPIVTIDRHVSCQEILKQGIKSLPFTLRLIKIHPLLNCKDNLSGNKDVMIVQTAPLFWIPNTQEKRPIGPKVYLSDSLLTRKQENKRPLFQSPNRRKNTLPAVLFRLLLAPSAVLNRQGFCPLIGLSGLTTNDISRKYSQCQNKIEGVSWLVVGWSKNSNITHRGKH